MPIVDVIVPSSRLAAVAADFVLPAAEIAPTIVRLAASDADEKGEAAMPHELEIEIKIAKGEEAIGAGVQRLGRPSSYACPACHGVLMQVAEGGLLRFRCHTGHSFTAEALITSQTEKIEETLWVSLRMFEERKNLPNNLAKGAKQGSRRRSYSEQAKAAQIHIERIRDASNGFVTP